MNFLHVRRTSLLSVAENIMTCGRAGAEGKGKGGQLLDPQIGPRRALARAEADEGTEGGRTHLLVVRRHAEDFLDVAAHVCWDDRGGRGGENRARREGPSRERRGEGGGGSKGLGVVELVVLLPREGLRESGRAREGGAGASERGRAAGGVEDRMRRPAPEEGWRRGMWAFRGGAAAAAGGRVSTRVLG